MVTRLAMNHVGITVPDIHAAVKWYTEVLGCYLLEPPAQVENDGTHFGNVVKDIFGLKFEGAILAHLATIDGVGIELFQFINPDVNIPNDNFEYWRAGIFHICVTAPDIESTVELISKTGGKVKSKIWKLWGNKEYKVAYCQDPWGTIIELSSNSYVQSWSNLKSPEI